MEQEINFGLKIKQLIDLKKETFEESGKRIGVTKSTVYRWTTQKDLGTDVLKQICKGYGVSMSYFLEGSKSYVQRDNVINAAINAVGEKIMNYANTAQNEGLSTKKDLDYNLLTERLKGCEEKNALLERMIKILENK